MSEHKTDEKTTQPAIDLHRMNIFQRMEAITAELKTVQKNLNVQAGKGSYKAVSERDIIDAVKPLEAQYGVYSYPCDREILESSMLESEKTYNGNTTKTTTFFTRVKTTYMFVNVDNPDENIKTVVFSEGIDTQDKGSGKAMTYADKYALMKMYKISTGDDPDQNPSEGDNYKKTGNNSWQGKSGNSNNQNTRPQRGPPIHTCSKCSNPIRDAIRKDGSLMPASEVVYFSMQRYGAPYCPDCQHQIEAQRRGQNN